MTKLLLFSMGVVLATLSPLGAGEPSVESNGLAVAADGRLLKDGRPYRGVGANDLKDQEKTWNVTFDNDRSYILQLTAEANRRWNRGP